MIEIIFNNLVVFSNDITTFFENYTSNIFEFTGYMVGLSIAFMVATMIKGVIK